ncbi:MAG: ankyrin repeat domain-containing protein [Candidatus Thorarchaeota archaeon]
MSSEELLLKAAEEGDLDGVKKALEDGANIDAKDDFFSNTALHIASSNGHIEIVRYLLEKGADIVIENGVDMTPVHLAARDGHPEIIKVLLDSADEFPSRKMDDAISVAQMSVSSSGYIVELLQKYRIKFVRPSAGDLEEADALLVTSSHDGDLVGVEKALEDGADIEVYGGRGLNSLLWASLRGRLEVVKLLLDRGADINATNRVGWTPILQASGGGHLEVVQLLLERGAEVNKVTKFSETALMFAAREGFIEIVKALLDNGADTSISDDDGMTAYKFAMRYGHSEVAELIGAPKSTGKKGLGQF